MESLNMYCLRCRLRSLTHVVPVRAAPRFSPQCHGVIKYNHRAPSFNRLIHEQQTNGLPRSYIQIRATSSERTHSGSPVRAVPVQVAHELLNAGHRYLDVRTAEEFASGHIEGAVNIPYMHKVGPGLTKNAKFLEDVGNNFGKDDEVVVGCQMGKRSQMAAEELVAAGYTGISDMAGGFLAWMQSGMPTKSRV